MTISNSTATNPTALVASASVMSTSPQTPPNGGGASRSFGTILSANTPSRSAKKAIVRKSRSRDRDADSARESDGDLRGESYSVAFEAGKIGLVLDPGSTAGPPHCLVQGLIPGGAASKDSRIAAGDYIHKVNDQVVTSYEEALRFLKVDGTREVVFVRSSVTAQASSSSQRSRMSHLSNPKAGRKPSSKGRGQSVPGTIRRSSTQTLSPQSVESRSSTSTVETSNRRGPSPVALASPSRQKETPLRTRSRSSDPPSRGGRRGPSESSPRASTPQVLDLTNAKKSLRFDPDSFTKSSPDAPPTGAAIATPSDRWYTPASDEMLLDEVLMQVPPSNVALSAASAVFARDPPSGQHLPRPLASSSPRKGMLTSTSSPAATTDTSRSKSPPRTPAELRVVALEAELQQEKKNTKILQQDRITRHQLTRELDDLKEANRTLRAENQSLQQQLATSKGHEESAQRLQTAEEKLSESQRELSNARLAMLQLQEDLSSARASHRGAEGDRCSLTQELEKFRADNERMRDIIADQHRQLEETTSASEKIREASTQALGVAEEQCRKYQLDLSASKATADRLESKLSAVQREAENDRAESEAALEKASAEIASLREQLLCREKALLSTQTENDSLDSRLSLLNEKLDEAVKEKLEHQRQISQLESTISASAHSSENDKLKSRIAELLRSHDVLTERLNQQETLYELEMEKAHLDNERLMAQVQDLKVSIERKSAEDSAVEYFKDQEREAAVEYQRQQMSDWHAKVLELESELASRTMSLKAANETIITLQNTNCNYESDVNRLTAIVDDMAKSKCQIQEKLSAARNELASTNDSRSLRIKSLESLCDQLRERVESKKQELDVAISSIRKLERNKQLIEERLVEVETRCSGMMTAKDQEVELGKSQLLLCKSEVADMRNQLSESQWQCELSRKRLTESQGCLAEATAELSKLRAEAQAFEASKRDQQRKVDSLSATNAELSERIESLHFALEECEEKLSSITASHNTALHSIEDLRSELSDRTKELSASQSELASCRDQCSEFSRRMAELNDETVAAEEAHRTCLASLREEISVAYAKRNEMEVLLLSVTRGASEAEARCTGVRELLDRERDNFSSFRQGADAYRKESEEWRRSAALRIKSLEDANLEKENEIKSLQNLSKSIEKQLVAAKEDAITAQERFVAAHEEVAQENEELSSALSVQRTRAEELSAQLNLVHARLVEQQQSFDLTQRNLEERIRLYAEDDANKSRLREEVLKSKELETTALFAYQDELERAKSDITRLNALLRRAKDESDHLRRANDDLRQQQVEKANHQLAKYRCDYESLLKEKQEVEHMLRKSEERMEAAEVRLLSSEEGLVAARSERERLIAEKNELLSELGYERDLVSSLRDELESQRDSSLCSSEGEVQGDFVGLTKSDLRSKCVELQEKLSLVREEHDALSKNAQNRAEQLSKVEEDRELLQNEIEKLILSNKALEARLEEAVTFKTEALHAENQYRAKLSKAEKHVRSLELRLDDQTKESDSLSTKLASLEAHRQAASMSYVSESKALNKTVFELKRQVQSSEMRLKSAEDERDRKVSEVLAMRLEAKALRDKVSTLESQLFYLKDQIQSAHQVNDVRQVENSGDVSRLTVTIDLLENERTLLNEKVARLVRELEAAREEHASYSENEEALRQKLEKLRQDALKAAETREEAVAKLSHASSVVEAQKESISILEQRASEAERTSGLLKTQVSHLQEALQKLDSSNESNAGFKDARIRELEQTVSSLEKQRDEAEATMRAQREEANRVRRNLIETEKLNAAIQARVESSKDGRDKAKMETEEVRGALEESMSAMRRLKDEAESKRLETDRLKANEKLLNATISRLNSDLLLYKEAALQAEFRLARTNANDGEIGRLRDEILRKTSKLENLSEVFHSQQQVLSLSQNLEEQLISFIEDVIRQVDEAFDWAPTSKSRGDAVWMRVEGRMELRCLDLAGLEKVCKQSSESRNALWHVIQDVLSKLESKRRQLCEWKQQRSQRVLSVMKTPDGKSRESSIPDTPTVTETLNNVKRVLSEHLSPLKQKAVSRLDVEYFQKVIHSLEHQIDILLEDLQSAKDALATKQQLFVDLEQIASHQEWEKSRLEKHLKQREAEIDELQRQVAMNRSSAERELANARAQLQESQQLLQLSRSSGVGDSMCSFDGDELHVPRHADSENAEQRHVSMQMARHLGESRLKLVKLKQLRLRRNTEPLKRIVEGNESAS